MNKTLFSIVALSVVALVSLFAANSQLTVTSAQTTEPDRLTRQNDDRNLASRIKRMTDRTGDGLVQRPTTRGTGVYMDLNDTFQNLMIARIDETGEPAAACVTSLDEANDFLGRDLETGEKIVSSRPQRTETANLAAKHGMSENEFEFYKKMIVDAAAQRVANPNTATINIVNGDGAGEGFNDPLVVSPEGGNTGTTRGQQRLNLFNFAAGIWGAFLDTSVQIDVNSQFNSLAPCSPSGGVLGSASATGITRDFGSAPLSGTWYHVALVNKLEGADQNGGSAEINARFNSDVDTGCLGGGSRFYYGLNNTTPSLRINLLVVLLHEMGHGLGFSSFMNGATGALNGGFPDVYTTNMFDRTTGKYWNAMTNAERVTSGINNTNVLWDGPNVKSASSFMAFGRDASGRVQLNTPSTFASGASISHFDTADTPNLLMEPNINIGIPLDLDLTKQEMRDIGWYRDTNADLVPDTITNVMPSGNTVTPGSTVAVTWTNNGGFSRNVTVELSTDGGVSFPTALATDIANTGTVNITVPATPTNSARVRVREAGFVDLIGMSSSTFTIGTRRPVADFDGDGKSDVSVWRSTDGNWYWINSANSTVSAFHFGSSGDVIVPGDYDGDGKTDFAVFRPSTGTWFISGTTAGFSGTQFGLSTDLPAQGDFDGDGKTDIGVFRPSIGTWYQLRSTIGFVAVQFGANGDKPVVGDYDGDGKADIAVFRPSDGNWYLSKSSDGFAVTHFGVATDKVVPGDYDGDGMTDVAVYRDGAPGSWYLMESTAGFVSTSFGTTNDVPVPGDFDGDGKTDTSVFRPASGTWFLLRSTSGFSANQFGVSTDKPVEASYVPTQ